MLSNFIQEIAMNIWLKTLIIGIAGAGGGCLGIVLTLLACAKWFYPFGAFFFILFWIPFGILFCLFFSNLAGEIVDRYD